VILIVSTAKLILVYKKYKTSFESRNKLFKHVFFNIYLLLTFTKKILIINKFSNIIKANTFNYKVIITNLV
jgi:hypothetical protein